MVRRFFIWGFVKESGWLAVLSAGAELLSAGGARISAGTELLSAGGARISAGVELLSAGGARISAATLKPP